MIVMMDHLAFIEWHVTIKRTPAAVGQREASLVATAGQFQRGIDVVALEKAVGQSAIQFKQ